MNCSNYVVNATYSGGDADAATPHSSTSSYLWLLGMACAIVSSLAVAFGTVLQKRAFLREALLDEDKRHAKKWGILLSRTWLLGLLCMLLQIPLTIAALALAPQSLVNPLGAGCTIVLSLILAVFLLKERMGRAEIMGSLLIIAGVVLTTAANAATPSEKLTACEILNRYGEADFLAAFVILLVLLLLCFVVIRNSARIAWPKLMPLVFAFSAGGMGALLNVFLKVVGEFIMGAAAGERSANEVWGTVHPYFSILFIIGLAFGMISFISQGLEVSVAVLFLPMYNCIFIVLSSLVGGLFFREFDKFQTAGQVMFPLGICVIVSGIAVSISGEANLPPITSNAALTGVVAAALRRKKVEDGLERPIIVAAGVAVGSEKEEGASPA